MIDEVMALREQGCTLSHTSMQALGYKQVMYYLEGFITKDMIEEIKRARRFAKRQLTLVQERQAHYLAETGRV